MQNKTKYALQIIILGVVIFPFLLIFLLPQTEMYHEATQKFEEFFQQKRVALAYEKSSVRVGFVFGYVLKQHAWFYPTMLLVSLLLSGLLVLAYQNLIKRKPKNFVLVDPLESIKNILSNMLLFGMAIFNRRASNQLGYYFELPVKSRIISLLAYALIFFAIAMLYDFPPDNYFVQQFGYMIYLWVLVPVGLIAITFFVPAFRRNYERKLFWLSISGMILFWIVSAYVGFSLANQYKIPINQQMDYFPFFSTKDMVTNLLIVLAFSFYIELMKSVLAEKGQMEGEIRVAQRIQNELIPEIEIRNEQFELFGKTVSAKEVGGDYIDAIDLENGKMAVAVADVSGHSVASGLLMSMLKTAFRTELKYAKDPAALTKSLNQTIYENKDKSMFISFISGIIDINKNVFSLINGGHPPLLHFSNKTKTFVEYLTGDLALGLKEDATYKTENISFSSGDLFVLFSDGLMESANVSGDEWGIEPIKNIIQKDQTATTREIYQNIFDESAAFRGSMEQRDDLTLLIIKIG